MNEALLVAPIDDDRVSSHAWADWVGMMASIGCAIHCAAMPLVIAYLPALGLSWLAGEGFHQWIAVVCFMVALLAFVPGWRIHNRSLPASLATVGLAVITAAAFDSSESCCPPAESGDAIAAAAAIETDAATCTDECCEHACVEGSVEAGNVTAGGAFPSFLPMSSGWWSPIGGALLVIGHILNRSFACRCRRCQAGDAGHAVR